MAELPYPIHKITSYKFLGVFSSNKLVTGIQIKKGSQHTTNIPITKHKVMADLEQNENLKKDRLRAPKITERPFYEAKFGYFEQA